MPYIKKQYFSKSNDDLLRLQYLLAYSIYADDTQCLQHELLFNATHSPHFDFQNKFCY